MLNTLKRSLLFVLMLGIFGAADLMAQETPPPPPTEEIELTEKVLEKFAVAYLELDEIRKELEVELQSVQSAEEAQEIQQKANVRMVAMLKEHDFTPEDYAKIVAVLNSDEEVREQFQEIIEELKKEDTDTDG